MTGGWSCNQAVYPVVSSVRTYCIRNSVTALSNGLPTLENMVDLEGYVILVVKTVHGNIKLFGESVGFFIDFMLETHHTALYRELFTVWYICID